MLELETNLRKVSQSWRRPLFKSSQGFISISSGIGADWCGLLECSGGVRAEEGEVTELIPDLTIENQHQHQLSGAHRGHHHGVVCAKYRADIYRYLLQLSRTAMLTTTC